MKVLNETGDWPITYRRIGRGRPIVYLHGFACDGGFFDGIAGRLASRFTAILPDQRGHGLSPCGRGTPSVADLAADLKDLLAVEAPSGAVAVGWSLGGAVLFDHVRRFGTAGLSGVVIIDMSPRVVGGEDWPHGAQGLPTIEVADRAAEAMILDWPSHAGAIARLTLAGNRPVDDGLANWMAERIAQNDPHRIVPIWRSLMRADNRAVMPMIDVPALIVCGGGSRLYRTDTAAWMAERMPDAQVECFGQSGHAPHLEEPERFADTLAAFMARLP